MVLNSSTVAPTLWLSCQRALVTGSPFLKMRLSQTPEPLQDWIQTPVLTLFLFCILPGDLSTPMAPPPILMGSQIHFLMALLSSQCLWPPPEAPLTLQVPKPNLCGSRLALPSVSWQHGWPAIHSVTAETQRPPKLLSPSSSPGKPYYQPCPLCP